MKNFTDLIQRHEAELQKLHSAVHDGFDRRETSKLARRDWELAAKRFREYGSEVDVLLKRCLVEGIAGDSELRRFAFCFVECDPYYFRSGYAMEGLLQKIKKLSLSEVEKGLLRKLILKRIDSKALRNFRHICRLIPIIDIVGFSNEVTSRARSQDPSIKRRAEFALSYFPIDCKHRGEGFVVV